MKSNKSATINFKSLSDDLKESLPLQFKGYEISDKGPVGFYRNINKVFTGIIFRDIKGNLTYFDVSMSTVSCFDTSFWADDLFIYQPQMTCLHIRCDTKNSKLIKC